MNFQLKPDRFDMRDFGTQPIELCGKMFVADQAGALYWPAQKALIVADLHLEKGSSRAARGQLLPPYDTRETLMKLAATMDQYEVDAVIALGDSLHDVAGAERMATEDLDILRILQDDRDWIWIAGNHDPEIAARLGGRVAPEIEVAGITLRHEPRAGRITHEIAGHLHPAARLVGARQHVAAAVLHRQRPAPRPAGVRRLHRRAQRARRGVPAAVRQRRIRGVDARRGRALPGRHAPVVRGLIPSSAPAQ